jgi:hypothetical protein
VFEAIITPLVPGVHEYERRLLIEDISKKTGFVYNRPRRYIINKEHRIFGVAYNNINNFPLAVFSDHAANQINRRGITPEDVREVLANPLSIAPSREGRVVIQGLVISEISRRSTLLRIFVNVDRNPPVIVTAYKTSKLEKYGVQQ